MDRRRLVLALVLVAVVGCESKPKSSTRTFPLRGVVRQVDLKAGEVTISHEEIVGLMGKMTMPFVVKKLDILEDVQAGDEVQGEVEVRYEADVIKDMDLTGLAVIRRPMPAPASPPMDAGSAPAVLKPGDPVPDFAVTTQDGRTLRLGDLKGKVVVLTFIYTRCPLPEFCPAMDRKFADLARRISTVASRSERVRLLSISFDPDHDTPEVLSSHAARQGARPPLWTFAVASHVELGRVSGQFGLTYVPGTREFNHNLRTAVIDAEGKLVRLEAGPGWDPADVFRSVLSLLSGPGK